MEIITNRKRILIVDDTKSLRLFYRQILAKEGFDIEDAINGIDALEKLLFQQFHLIIVDINMPKMDGISFIENYRNSPEGISIPILVVSTESMEADKQKAFAVGANFYLTKPINQTIFVNCVQLMV